MQLNHRLNRQKNISEVAGKFVHVAGEARDLLNFPKKLLPRQQA
jgi:hypothetical protein